MLHSFFCLFVQIVLVFSFFLFSSVVFYGGVFVGGVMCEVWVECEAGERVKE